MAGDAAITINTLPHILGFPCVFAFRVVCGHFHGASLMAVLHFCQGMME